MKKMLLSAMIFVLMLLPVYAQDVMDGSDCIVIKFTSSITPSLVNGTVVTGLQL